MLNMFGGAIIFAIGVIIGGALVKMGMGEK